jgi:hypothetical protein
MYDRVLLVTTVSPKEFDGSTYEDENDDENSSTINMTLSPTVHMRVESLHHLHRREGAANGMIHRC